MSPSVMMLALGTATCLALLYWWWQGTRSRDPRAEQPRLTGTRRSASVLGIAAVAILTLLYWFWESRAEGNIRMDLLLIYPALFVCYVAGLWPRFRWYSITLALTLMILNVVFFIASHRWFGKHPG